jgi:arginyl-tRNA synthetase
VRYFLVKFSRGKVIAFDIEEALSFEGETGPYIQYAAVRAGNILAKLGERAGIGEQDIVARLPSLSREAIDTGEDADELWGLVLDAARLDEIVDVAVRSLELARLRSTRSGWRRRSTPSIIPSRFFEEEREDARMWRAAAVAYVRRQLAQALDLMGCDVPARM